MKHHKKGNTSGWQLFGYSIAVGVVTFAVLAILLQAFLTTSSVSCPALYTYNTSSDSCYLTSNASVTAPTTIAGNVTRDGLTFIDNTTSQFSTAGTVLGVSLLLLIIAALGIGGYKYYRNNVR